jgi:hypothetical protein
MTDRSPILSTWVFAQALIDAGIIAPEDKVTRVIIDSGQLNKLEPVRIHIECVGDTRWLKLVPGLNGAEICREERTVEHGPARA